MITCTTAPNTKKTMKNHSTPRTLTVLGSWPSSIARAVSCALGGGMCMGINSFVKRRVLDARHQRTDAQQQQHRRKPDPKQRQRNNDIQEMRNAGCQELEIFNTQIAHAARG